MNQRNRREKIKKALAMQASLSMTMLLRRLPARTYCWLTCHSIFCSHPQTQKQSERKRVWRKGSNVYRALSESNVKVENALWKMQKYNKVLKGRYQILQSDRDQQRILKIIEGKSFRNIDSDRMWIFTSKNEKSWKNFNSTSDSWKKQKKSIGTAMDDKHQTVLRTRWGQQTNREKKTMKKQNPFLNAPWERLYKGVSWD